MNERNESHNENEGSSYPESENAAEHSGNEIQIDKNAAPPAQKTEIAVAPHKKSKQMHSNKQALCEIAQSLESFSEAQNKRHQKTLDEERKQEERFLEFKREEVEKDLQHELRLAEMLSANRYHARDFYFNRKHGSKQFLHLIKAFIPTFFQDSSFHPLITRILSHRQVFSGVSRSIPY